MTWNSFFTRRRIHGHAILLLAVALVLGYAVKIYVDTPDPNDFFQNYVAGWLVAHHRAADLYNRAAWKAVGDQLLSTNDSPHFLPLYGPQVALAFAPLALLPFWLAVLLWKALSFAIYVICCYALWRACPDLRRQHDWAPLLTLAVAFPAVYCMLAHGQISVLVLVAFTIAFLTLPQRPFMAGLAIGLIAYKPHLGIVAAGVFLVTGQWKVLLGAVTAIAGQFAVAGAVLGPRVLSAYARTAPQVYAGQFQIDADWLGQLVSLRSFWQRLLPGSYALGAYLVSAGLIMIITILPWRRPVSYKPRFSLLLVATVLVSPHAFMYDLVMLAPAFLFAVEWLATHPDGKDRHILRAALYGSYLLPMVSSQVGVIALTVFALLLYQQIRSEARSPGYAAAPTLVGARG